MTSPAARWQCLYGMRQCLRFATTLLDAPQLSGEHWKAVHVPPTHNWLIPKTECINEILKRFRNNWNLLIIVFESLTLTTTIPNTACHRLLFTSENGVWSNLLSHCWISLTPPLPPVMHPSRFSRQGPLLLPFWPSAALQSRQPTSPTSRHLEWLGLPISRGNLNPPYRQTQSDRKQGATGESWKQRYPLREKSGREE